MDKSQAIKIVNENGKSLSVQNTHWSNVIEYGQDSGWWLNIPFKKFDSNLYIILHYRSLKQFILLEIKARSITSPRDKFRKKGETADIYISLNVNGSNLDSSSLKDTQSNGTGYNFSIHDTRLFNYAESKLSNENQFPNEVNQRFIEGSTVTVAVNKYERSSVARKVCIANHGLNCSVCEFNFEDFYGERGVGFIHIHHLIPLADIGHEYIIDPIKDLRPVCPNCHAMLHRMGNISIGELKKEVLNNKSVDHKHT